MTGKYLSRIFSDKRSFTLRKLYLDCIDEQGNCIIVYLARLEYLFSRFYYSSVIYSGKNGRTSENSSMRWNNLPDTKGILDIRHEKLGISGKWVACDNPVTLPVYTVGHNKGVFWNCHHPKATADISFSGNSIKGLGYAESLLVSVEPWNLPLEELRWGRFLSEKHTIIWISWVGKHNFSKVILDGLEYDDPVFADDKLVFGGDNVLIFNEVFQVRKEKIGDIFTKATALRLLIRMNKLNAGETKYKARSTYSKGTSALATGWSLYETVSWKN